MTESVRVDRLSTLSCRFCPGARLRMGLLAGAALIALPCQRTVAQTRQCQAPAEKDRRKRSIYKLRRTTCSLKGAEPVRLHRRCDRPLRRHGCIAIRSGAAARARNDPHSAKNRSDVPLDARWQGSGFRLEQPVPDFVHQPRSASTALDLCVGEPQNYLNSITKTIPRHWTAGIWWGLLRLRMGINNHLATTKAASGSRNEAIQ